MDTRMNCDLLGNISLLQSNIYLTPSLYDGLTKMEVFTEEEMQIIKVISYFIILLKFLFSKK